MILYIPSNFGDLTLEPAPAEKECFLRTHQLSIPEETVLKKVLTKYGLQPGEKFDDRKYVLPVSMDKARKYLTRVLKGHKQTILAYKIEGPASMGKQVEEVGTVVEAEKRGAKKAVETTAPDRGCPPPLFDKFKEAEIRATRVLHEFTTPEQQEDLRKTFSMVVTGGETGHRYLVSHRFSRNASRLGIVHDIDKGRALCVHQSELPAAEELLALLVALQCREQKWVDYQLNE